MRDLLGDIRGRALPVVLGCLVCQMGLGFGYGPTPLAPAMLEELGWSRALLSAAQTSQGFMIAIASPPVGFGVARFGGRAVLCVGAVVLGLGYGLFSLVQSWWHLAVAWSLVGIGVAGLGDITVGAIVARRVHRSRGLALGIVYAGSNLGGWLATRGMVAVAEEGSWRVAIAGAALASFAILLPTAWFAVGRSDVSAEDSEEGDEAARVEEALEPLGVSEALRTRSFWIIAFALLGFWLYLYSVLGHFGLALADGGMATSDYGAYWSNAVLMGLVSKVAFGVLANRMEAKSALLLDYGLLAVSSLLLVGLPGGDPVVIWSFLLIFGFSYAARDLVTPLILIRCFGARNLAQLYGLLMLTILPGNLGGVITGWSFDRTHSYLSAFLGLAVWNVLSFVLLFALLCPK
jgi:MFS family permease